MSFKDAVAADIKGVFLNTSEFADYRTVIYDGEEYADIPVVLTSIKERDRRIVTGDHAQGLYLASVVLHAAKEDLGGSLPEKGGKIRVSDDTGFLRDYYIAKSGVEMGMLRLELEGIDE